MGKLQENAPLIIEIRNDIIYDVLANGEVAQLVEHHVRNVGVESSNLFFSTIQKAFHPEIKGEAFFCWRKWLNGFIKLNSSLLYVDMLDIGQCGFFGVL